MATLDASGEQSLYVCGITPYDATHMGHAASYVAFDLLNRAWRDGGQQVSYVQNVTDVDDPLLERATATGVDWRDLAASQIELFQTDMEALNVLAPDHYVGAVESIPMIVPAIEGLLQRGLAYRVPGVDGEPDGDVYYDVEAAGKHAPEVDDAWTLGAISGLSDAEMLELFAERGGDPGRAGKRQALDPLLWRVARDRGAQLARRRAGGGAARLAHRMYRHRPGVPAGTVHRAGRRLGPDLPAPRDGRRPCLLPGRRAAGTPLRACRHGRPRRRKDEQIQGQPRPGLRLRADGEEPAAIRLAILAHHYRTDWSWTDGGIHRGQGAASQLARGSGAGPGGLCRPARRPDAERAVQ